MSSPYVPTPAGLRYRRGLSSVFRSRPRKYELPLAPRPKDVDHHHANLYIKTGRRNRPAARRELHANYAHEVAKRVGETDWRYLGHLADDLGTHETLDDPGKLRRMLHKDYCALFRPRLDVFFDMRLPTDEDKRNGGDKVPSDAEYSLIIEEHRQRIQYIESAVAVAWCRYQLEDLQRRMRLNTYTCDEIWKIHEKWRQPGDVTKAAQSFLKRERELDYLLLLEATLKERIPELEDPQSSKWPLKKAKAAYKDSKTQSNDADESASSTAAFHRTVAVRTRGSSEQPKSAHLRTEIQETGFWVAWALSRPNSTHLYGDNWPEQLGIFLEKARAQGLFEARPTLSLLKDYRALAPFYEGRKPEVGEWETRPPRRLSEISIPGGSLYERDDLSGTTPTAHSASTAHDAAS